MPTYATFEEATKNIGPHRVNLLGIDLDFLKPPTEEKYYFKTPKISTLTEEIKSKLKDKEKKEIEAKAKPDQLKYINSSLRKEYYIVKIAGKGNFKKKAVEEFKNTASGEYKKEEKTHSELEKFFQDNENNENNKKDTMESKLNNDLTKLEKKIIEEMNRKNKNKLLIIWDGDNFQGLTDDKPSPFTELIVRLKDLKGTGVGNVPVDYLALKEGKVNEYGPQFWKKNKIDDWEKNLKNKNFMISYMDKEYSEVHQHTEDLCHMYIDYGSTKYYEDNKDTFINKNNQYVKKVPNEPTGLTQLKELRKKGFELESNEPNETNKRYDILIKDDTSYNHSQNISGGSRKNNKLSKKRKHKKNTKKKNKRNTKTNIKK